MKKKLEEFSINIYKLFLLFVKKYGNILNIINYGGNMNKNKVKINSIIVRELFETYDYDIPSFEKKELDKLCILYGDNGCGKTTILNCLYHILSPIPLGGHRTFVGNVIFKEFSIYLSNEYVISYSRDNLKKKSYKVIVSNGCKKSIEFIWYPKEEKIDDYDREYNDYCELLESFKLNIYYLSAHRNIQQDERGWHRGSRPLGASTGN